MGETLRVTDCKGPALGGFAFAVGETLRHRCPGADGSLRFFVARRCAAPAADLRREPVSRSYLCRVFTSTEMLPALVELEECELAALPPEGEAPF